METEPSFSRVADGGVEVMLDEDGARTVELFTDVVRARVREGIAKRMPRRCQENLTSHPLDHHVILEANSGGKYPIYHQYFPRVGFVLPC